MHARVAVSPCAKLDASRRLRVQKALDVGIELEEVNALYDGRRERDKQEQQEGCELEEWGERGEEEHDGIRRSSFQARPLREKREDGDGQCRQRGPHICLAALRPWGVVSEDKRLLLQRAHGVTEHDVTGE